MAATTSSARGAKTRSGEREAKRTSATATVAGTAPRRRDAKPYARSPERQWTVCRIHGRRGVYAQGHSRTLELRERDGDRRGVPGAGWRRLGAVQELGWPEAAEEELGRSLGDPQGGGRFERGQERDPDRIRPGREHGRRRRRRHRRDRFRRDPGRHCWHRRPGGRAGSERKAGK